MRDISLQLEPGTFLAIVGKSGSGKTTLLKCIYGLEDLPAGTITLDEEPVLGPAYHLMPGHEDMKLVSQDYYVLENHTVAENIFDKLIGYTNEVKEKRAKKLLHLLELEALRDTRAKHLSSGQKQRVAIARALAIIPKLLLLDEPFSNLDKLLSDKLFAFILKEVKQSKSSVILITHVAEEALKYADYIAVMDEGRILQQGEKWQVYYHPKNSRLAGLLGHYNIIRNGDLLKKRAARFPSKLLVRADKLKVLSAAEQADLECVVTGNVFNGKCVEVSAETSSGHDLLFYHAKALPLNKKLFCKIERP